MTDPSPPEAHHALIEKVFRQLTDLAAVCNDKSVVQPRLSGLCDLDDQIMFAQEPLFIILAGRPSVGRTALATHIILGSTLVGRRLFYSIDIPEQLLVMRMLAAHGRVDKNRLSTGQMNQRDFERMAHTAGTISDAPLRIIDAFTWSVDQILADARGQAAEHRPVGMVIVDGLELLGLNPQAYDAALLAFRALSRELCCTVIVTLPLGPALERRSNRRPTLTDVETSSVIAGAADVIIGLYRDAMYNNNTEHSSEMELLVMKQKNGPLGLVRVMFFDQNLSINNIRDT